MVTFTFLNNNRVPYDFSTCCNVKMFILVYIIPSSCFNALCNILEKENLFFYLTRENTNDKNINFGRINIEEISRNFNKNSYFYICGSNDFMSHFKSNLEKLGYENIVLDEWE